MTQIINTWEEQREILLEIAALCSLNPEVQVGIDITSLGYSHQRATHRY
ncbi:MAG: hypothetical protein K0S08_2016 [Gammaproteobacteria bacterium]|jgi:hypothetical protein|nr:hypothetical protein [Gammaproteobacteria bacterium]